MADEHKNFIDGQWQAARSGKVFENRRPVSFRVDHLIGPVSFVGIARDPGPQPPRYLACPGGDVQDDLGDRVGGFERAGRGDPGVHAIEGGADRGAEPGVAVIRALQLLENSIDFSHLRYPQGKRTGV